MVNYCKKGKRKKKEEIFPTVLKRVVVKESSQ